MNPQLKKVGVVWNPGEQCSDACLLKARIVCKELGIELIEAVATNTSEVAEAAKSLLARGVEAIWIGGDTVAIASAPLIINIAASAGLPVFTNDPTDVPKGALFGFGADYFTVGEITADLGIEILRGKDPATIPVDNRVPEILEINSAWMNEHSKSWTITDYVQHILDKNPIRQQSSTGIIDFEITPNPDKQSILAAGQFLNYQKKLNRPAKIALVTLIENKTLDQAVAGFKQGMKEAGFVEGRDILYKTYSAQGEISQLPALFDAATREQTDLILTVTTPALIAAANKLHDVPVVFTVASQPSRLNLFLEDKKANFCGVYDDPAVDELLGMAIRHKPSLKKVGVIHDPSQMNSMISVNKLKAAAAVTNTEVLQAGVSSVTELGMAAETLIQRGADAFILSADNLVSTGFSTIIQVTSRAKIPVYVTEINLVTQGAYACIGDNFFDWGMESAEMAAKVLAGISPLELGFHPTSHKKTIDPLNPEISIQSKKISIVLYSETEFAERSYEGLLDGFQQAGLIKDLDYSLKVFNAQGDMSTLSSIMATIKADKSDILCAISTPALQAALSQAGPDVNIVFTAVADGVKAGAGSSETNHLPNVTGITTRSSFADMAKLIKQSVPGVKKVGTLFTPSEVNSELYKSLLEEALKSNGIELVYLPVTASADIPQAADELFRQKIQVLAQIADNLTRPGFGLISRKAAESNVPVYIFDSGQMKNGASVCLARDYYDAGIEASCKVSMILRGKNPAEIPFSNTLSEKFMYDPAHIKKYGIKLPEDFLKRAVIYQPK